jgi:hypothetical protein
MDDGSRAVGEYAVRREDKPLVGQSLLEKNEQRKRGRKEDVSEMIFIMYALSVSHVTLALALQSVVGFIQECPRRRCWWTC